MLFDSGVWTKGLLLDESKIVIRDQHSMKLFDLEIVILFFSCIIEARNGGGGEGGEWRIEEEDNN